MTKAILILLMGFAAQAAGPNDKGICAKAYKYEVKSEDMAGDPDLARELEVSDYAEHLNEYAAQHGQPCSGWEPGQYENWRAYVIQENNQPCEDCVAK